MSNMKKYWKYIDWEQCPSCGDTLQAFTDCEENGYFCDGDDVRCCGDNEDCEATNLYLSVTEDGSAFVNGNW